MKLTVIFIYSTCVVLCQKYNLERSWDLNSPKNITLTHYIHGLMSTVQDSMAEMHVFQRVRNKLSADSKNCH